MIPPADQWAIQIDVTSACNRACSNCTRLVGHDKPQHMGRKSFTQAVQAVAEFPQHGGLRTATKLVGLIGGEPLLHPEFAALVDIMAEFIPWGYRGLWTGLDWERSRYAELITKEIPNYGIHNNRHDLHANLHTPILVASVDAIPDEAERKKVIDACWLQREWCSTITSKGYFFCEVAGALDRVFGGPGGLPVEPGCWKRPLSDFQTQIDQWCNRCGVALCLAGRTDREEVDDISQTNLEELADSLRISRGQYCKYVPGSLQTISEPWAYKQGETH